MVDQLVAIGVDRGGIRIDDPADVALMTKAMAEPSEKGLSRGVVTLISVLIGALVALPLALVDWGPDYWLRYIVTFFVVFLIAGRAMAVHFLFKKPDRDGQTPTSVLRVPTNDPHVRDALEKSDAVRIEEVPAPAPK
jgi:hypothetical protein